MTIDSRLHAEAVEEVVRLRTEVASLREAYSAKSLELAKLREGINAAMYPVQYDRAQREGNFS